MNVKVGYSQGAKVSSPRDKYENANFQVSLSLEFEHEAPPETEAAHKVWEEGLRARMKETVAGLRLQVEEELQTDIDQFKEDNGG
jgi:hypothetical protein